MSNKQFYSIVRQYARLAQRMRRSYAEQVAEAYRLRQAAVSTSELSDDQKASVLSQNADFVAREYGSVDASWETPLS